MSIISSDINRAIQILNSEDVVAIPTETVYGLAGNIYSEKAIKKIFEVKERPLFNPLIVHLHTIDQVRKVVTVFPDKAKQLAAAFWPGSLTLVLKKHASVPDLITANKDTVAIRIPNHPVTLELLKELDFPLAAPSANPFNRISPTKSTHVEAYFKDKITMVLEGGSCNNGLESTIIGFENELPVLYRLGSISVEEIEMVIGKIQINNKKDKAPNAPGMLAKHYAPKTKTHLVDDIDQFLKEQSSKRIGTLTLSKQMKSPNIISSEVLSADANLKEAASKLYAALHKLDAQDLDLIVIERFPNKGVGATINDRLERATK
jgi:L-threonylcarbamoyladenylate synthase